MEWQTLEGRQHTELELEGIIGGDNEGHEMVGGVFGKLNIESLLGGRQ